MFMGWGSALLTQCQGASLDHLLLHPEPQGFFPDPFWLDVLALIVTWFLSGLTNTWNMNVKMKRFVVEKIQERWVYRKQWYGNKRGQDKCTWLGEHPSMQRILHFASWMPILLCSLFRTRTGECHLRITLVIHVRKRIWSWNQKDKASDQGFDPTSKDRPISVYLCVLRGVSLVSVSLFTIPHLTFLLIPQLTPYEWFHRRCHLVLSYWTQ